MSLLSSLVSYWKLDESSGNAADSVGSNTLTNTGTATYGSALINNGVDFSTSNTTKWLSVASAMGWTGVGSYSVWINPNEAISANQWDAVYHTYQAAGYLFYLRYTYNSGSPKIQAILQKYSGPSTTLEYSVGLSTSTWYHLAYTCDGSSMKLYLNGSLVASGSFPGGSGGGGAPADIFATGNTSTTAGSWKMDELAFWSRELTLDEVTSLYNGGIGAQYAFAPLVTTQAVSSIAVETATGNGNVTSSGGGIVTERGIAWNTATAPLLTDHKVVASGTTGAYTGSITGLTANTLYYVRAYAINSYGTTYGNEVTFTSAVLPNDTIYYDMNGVEGETYAVSVDVGGSLGTLTVKLGSTGTSQVINAGAGTTVVQGTYGGLNGLTFVASGTFNGYIDNVFYVLILGDASINWSLDSLTNVYPINSQVLFKRLEDQDFDKFRIYRYLDIQFKDLNAYVTVLLKKEANEDASDSSKQFLVSNVSGETLPFINKKISMLTKNYGMRVGLSNNRLDETFTVCQFVISGTEQMKKTFASSKIISVS